jgi:hypothetical protein
VLIVLLVKGSHSLPCLTHREIVAAATP